MNYCLGNSCRFYREKPDAICFKQGVFPGCSPRLKQERISLDNASVDMYQALKEIAPRIVDPATLNIILKALAKS